MKAQKQETAHVQGESGAGGRRSQIAEGLDFDLYSADHKATERFTLKKCSLESNLFGKCCTLCPSLGYLQCII